MQSSLYLDLLRIDVLVLFNSGSPTLRSIAEYKEYQTFNCSYVGIERYTMTYPHLSGFRHGLFGQCGLSSVFFTKNNICDRMLFILLTFSLFWFYRFTIFTLVFFLIICIIYLPTILLELFFLHSSRERSSAFIRVYVEQHRAQYEALTNTISGFNTLSNFTFDSHLTASAFVEILYYEKLNG